MSGDSPQPESAPSEGPLADLQAGAKRLEELPKKCETLKADVESMKDWDLAKFIEFFQKCSDSPETLFLLPLIFFQKLGTTIQTELPPGEDAVLTPNKETFSSEEVERLKKIEPTMERFAPKSNLTLASEMREKRKDLYDMISYASNSIGVPFALLSAVFYHESSFTAGAIIGDRGAAIGIGQMHGPAYKTGTGTDYYKKAMGLAPGEEPPARGEMPLSDILASASLLRWTTEHLGISPYNMTKRDIVSIRAYYHELVKHPARLKLYTEIFISKTKTLESVESAKERKILQNYDNFANRVLGYDQSVKTSYV